MAIDFNGKVPIVTGAGGGLGRQHALALAARGAKVVVNDFGRSAAGPDGVPASAADPVVREILAAGGEAMGNAASVTDEAAVAVMVEEVLARWGRIDILVNNAGILRDKSSPDAAEQLAVRFAEVIERSGETVPQDGSAQGTAELSKAQQQR